MKGSFFSHDFDNLLAQGVIWVLVFWLLAICLRVYGRLAERVWTGKGKVWVEPLGMPDAMAVTVLGTLMAGQTALAVFQRSPMPAITDKLIIVSAVFYGMVVVAIAVFLWTRKILVCQLFGLLPAEPLEVLKKGARFLVMALPLVAFSYWLVQRVAGEETVPQELITYFTDAAQQLHWQRLLLSAGLATLIAPVTEEFLFRGYIYGVLRRYLGAVPGLLIASVLFAAIHMNGPAFAPLFVLAACLTLAYEATGSLLTPMLMHALFNAVNLIYAFCSVRYS